MSAKSIDYVDMEFSPGRATAGIRFRRYRGDDDFASLSDICFKSWSADHVDFQKTSEDFRGAYEASSSRDPSKELVIAEVGDTPVAFAEANSVRKSENELLCFQYVHVLPDYRGEGLREALLRFNERALRDAVRDEPSSERRVYHSWALSSPNDWQSVLLSEGYSPVWHLFEMVRSNLDDVPEVPLPEGVFMRPITEADYRKVWDASKAAFMDQPWSKDEAWDEAHYKKWLTSSEFTPELWQIAWDGDEVAGSVQNYIDHGENETFGRRRGHTERIFVTPPWRGKGLAKALISRSLLLLREKGMTEAILDTEEANVYQAYKVYERMGYRIVNQFTFYQKPLEL
jgi:mycothiol synthase